MCTCHVIFNNIQNEFLKFIYLLPVFSLDLEIECVPDELSQKAQIAQIAQHTETTRRINTSNRKQFFVASSEKQNCMQHPIAAHSHPRQNHHQT